MKYIWVLLTNIFHVFKNAIVIQEVMSEVPIHNIPTIEWRNTGLLTIMSKSPPLGTLPNVNIPLILHNELY